MDELDIDLTKKSDYEKEKIIKQIQVIVFNDNSVNIGDGNKIKDSNIASRIKE